MQRALFISLSALKHCLPFYCPVTHVWWYCDGPSAGPHNHILSLLFQSSFHLQTSIFSLFSGPHPGPLWTCWKAHIFIACPWWWLLGILTIYSYLLFFLLDNYLSLEVSFLLQNGSLASLQAFAERPGQKPSGNLTSLYQSDHPYLHAFWLFKGLQGWK